MWSALFLASLATPYYHTLCTNARGTQLVSFVAPETPLTYRDVTRFFYYYLGYTGDVSKGRFLACGDFDQNGKLDYSDLLRTFYVYLEYLAPPTFECRPPSIAADPAALVGGGEYTLGHELVRQYRNEYGDCNLFLNSRECQNTCPYRYALSLPATYPRADSSISAMAAPLPLIVNLHGGWSNEHPESWDYSVALKELGAIAVFPTKQETDWTPAKLREILRDLYRRGVVFDVAQMVVTGCSMGGRGALLASHDLPRLFPRSRPVAPHHLPTDLRYVAAAFPRYNVSLRVAMHSADTISDFSMARDIATSMEANGGDVEAAFPDGLGHCSAETYALMVEYVRQDLEEFRRPAATRTRVVHAPTHYGVQIGVPLFSFLADRGNLLDTPRLLAQHGFAHMELYIPAMSSSLASLSTGDDPRSVTESDVVPFADELRAHNVTLAGFLIDDDFEPIGGSSDAGVPRHIEYVSSQGPAWRRLGVQYIRLNLYGSHDEHGMSRAEWIRTVCAPRLRQIADACRQFDLLLTVENHGTFDAASDMRLLRESVNHSHFGLLVDTANFGTSDAPSALSLASEASVVCVKVLSDAGASVPQLTDDGTTVDTHTLATRFVHNAVERKYAVPMIEFHGGGLSDTRMEDAIASIASVRDRLVHLLGSYYVP